jgi:hypothetical protein
MLGAPAETRGGAKFWFRRLLLAARRLLFGRVSPPVESDGTGGDQEADLLINFAELLVIPAKAGIQSLPRT